jgi:hypothetical protein
LFAATAAARTQLVPNMIVLDEPGATYDFGGATLKWTGAGDCSQTEGMLPMFSITAPRITLRNATIIGAPDGIHIHSAGAILENLIFPDVCEDAVTFKRGSRHATVRYCKFAEAADKVIQATDGRRHRIHHCEFVRCQRPLRCGPTTGARFYDNTLTDCHSGVRAHGIGSVTLIWGNTFTRVRHPVQKLEGARIIRFR